MEYKRLTLDKVSYWYNPIGLKRTYGVVLNLTENERTIKVHYKCDVFFLKKDFNNYFYFNVRKGQVYINEKQPDLIFDEIADECGKVLYPIEIKVSPYGEIVNIMNYVEIKERWKKKREILSKSYKGKEVSILLEKMDTSINNFSIIKETFKKEWFLALFFSPIHNAYGTPKANTNLEFDIIPYKLPIKYNAEQFVTNNPNEIGSIIYHQIGKCCDLRRERDILKGNLFSETEADQLAEGNLNITYEIYKDSPAFDRILGSCSLTLPSGYSKKVEIEIYNLENEQPKTTFEEQIEAEQEKKKEPKPKKRFSFW